MRETLSSKGSRGSSSASDKRSKPAPRTPLQAAALISEARQEVSEGSSAPPRVANEPGITTGTVFAQLIALTDQVPLTLPYSLWPCMQKNSPFA